MLTARQAQFVAQYQLSGNGKRSTIAAGYAVGSAEVTASQLLRNPKVAAALAVQRAAAEAHFKITREHVVNGLLDSVSEARRTGNPIAQIRGWSELAKLLGYYAPEVRKVELSTESRALSAKYEAMSDDELLEIAVIRQ